MVVCWSRDWKVHCLGHWTRRKFLRILISKWTKCFPAREIKPPVLYGQWRMFLAKSTHFWMTISALNMMKLFKWNTYVIRPTAFILIFDAIHFCVCQPFCWQLRGKHWPVNCLVLLPLTLKVLVRPPNHQSINNCKSKGWAHMIVFHRACTDLLESRSVAGLYESSKGFWVIYIKRAEEMLRGSGVCELHAIL